MAPEYYVFTGRDGEVISRHITHVLIDKSLKFVPARAFSRHRNIEEVICHDGVEMIEEEAFERCPRLRRVIMPGVKIIEKRAFDMCPALIYVECGILKRIGEGAFQWCESLSSIDLPSIKIVEAGAFLSCSNLINAKFGKELESIGEKTFHDCPSLERIALPLKDGMITDDDIFQECEKLESVDLVGGVHETVAALLMEDWTNDMNKEIESIHQILPNTFAGNFRYVGGKAQEIRRWITSVLRKYNKYKSKHCRYLNVAAAALQQALPNDIVLKNILPFVELPSDTFDGEDQLAREEQAQEMMATRMQQLTPCKHGVDPDCLKLDNIVFQFAYEFRKEFNEAIERSDLYPQNFLTAAKDATMDEFADVWNDSATMKMAISFLLCMGTQDILEGEFLDARKSALFVRYLKQYIAVGLKQTQALYNWPKIGELYVADDHTLVKFFRRRIPCSCLDEKYEEVKHITKMGLCWNPQCSFPNGEVERSKMMDCSRCRNATYCSRKCQVEHWIYHKPDCKKYAAEKAAFEARQQNTHEQEI